MDARSLPRLLAAAALLAALGPLSACSSLSAYRSRKSLEQRIVKFFPQGTRREDVVQGLAQRGIAAERIYVEEYDQPRRASITADEALFEVDEGAEVWSLVVGHAEPVLVFVPLPAQRNSHYLFEFDEDQRLLNSHVRQYLLP